MTYNYAPLIGLVPETCVSINKDFSLRLRLEMDKDMYLKPNFAHT